MTDSRRRRPLPRTLLATIGLVSLVILGACGSEGKQTERLVRGALQRTSRLSHKFVYAIESDGRAYSVAGVVEDTLRYSARVSLAGRPRVDQVVHDDAVALRLLEVASTRRMTKAGGGGWLIDRNGAPVRGALDTGAKATMGEDPVADAIGVFEYIDEAVARAQAVRVFNPEAIDYRPEEDPFPKPSRGSGIVRYDLQRPDLPSASQVANNEAVPGVQHFRRMSLYLKEGLIVRAMDAVSIGDKIDEVERNYDIRLPDDLSDEEIDRVVLGALNALLREQGREPIPARNMSLSLSELGAPQAVRLPSGATVARVPTLNRVLLEASARDSSTDPDGSGAPPTAPVPSPPPSSIRIPLFPRPAAAGPTTNAGAEQVSIVLLLSWTLALPVALMAAIVLAARRRSAALR